jgi:hypothetical protein
MPLLANDVREILRTAIVEARFAPEEAAGTFADTLAGPVTDGLNTVMSVSERVEASPSMTIGEAITLRNELSKIVSEAGQGNVTDETSKRIAERLLVANLVDVGGVLHSATQAVRTGMIATVQATTGQHAAVESAYPVRIPTGSVPAQDSIN